MRRPNILLVTTDQQRWDTLGVNTNGNSLCRTPNLDALAARGRNFTRAYTTTPSCIAARRTLLTGQHGARHGLVGYRDGLEFDPPFTLPGILGDAGYQTELVGKLHMFPQGRRFGFDHLVLSETPAWRPGSAWFGRNDYVEWLQSKLGPDADPDLHGVDGNGRLARPYHYDEVYHHSSWVTRQATNFLTRRRDPSCPFFLHLSYWAPHPPLVPPAVYFERYLRCADQWQPTYGDWDPPRHDPPLGIAPDSATGPYPLEVMREAMAGYYGLINHVDDCLAYLLKRVFGYGGSLADEPVWIVFTSDHGEMLGDHDLYRKSLPYEGSAHVPFFVTSHGIPMERGTSDALVCLEDVCPTLLDLAGLPLPEPLDGHSLAPVLRGEAGSVRDTLYEEHSGQFAHHAVIHGSTKYIWYARTGEEQLFDLATDPCESRDRSAETARLEPFRDLLAARLARREDYTFDRSALKPLANRAPRAVWGDRADEWRKYAPPETLTERGST